MQHHCSLRAQHAADAAAAAAAADQCHHNGLDCTYYDTNEHLLPVLKMAAIYVIVLVASLGTFPSSKAFPGLGLSFK